MTLLLVAGKFEKIKTEIKSLVFAITTKLLSFHVKRTTKIDEDGHQKLDQLLFYLAATNDMRLTFTVRHCF